MARLRSTYVCGECGGEQSRWLGRCPDCGALRRWSSRRRAPTTHAAARAAGRRTRLVVPLASVETSAAERIGTGIAELDRVLGGGLVPGSLVLLGGEPGVGKSSLTAAMLGAIGAQRPVLLVAGEESPEQVRLRAERIGATAGVGVLAETELETVCATIEAVGAGGLRRRLDPDALGRAALGGAGIGLAGARVGRAAAAPGQGQEHLHRPDRARDEGGRRRRPAVLEHLVDVVLMFEGDALRSLRVLRAQKNRFGATDEIGLFEMSDRGLISVTDASRLHDRADLDRPGSCTFVAMEGTRPLTIDVQALVAPSELAMPRRLASGFDRNRLSLLLAVLARHGGLGLGQHDVFVNVAGGVRVDEPAADLAVALALVSAARGVAPPAGIEVATWSSPGAPHRGWRVAGQQAGA